MRAGAAVVAGTRGDVGDPRELQERRAQQKCTRARGGRGIAARVGEVLGVCGGARWGLRGAREICVAIDG